MSDRWWAGLGPVEVRLDCSGATHRVRWADGRLSAIAHDDVMGERTLAALAGEQPPCLHLLDLWDRHRADLRLLVVASRGPGDPLGSDGPPRGPRGSWRGVAPMTMGAATTVHHRLGGVAGPPMGPQLAGTGGDDLGLTELAMTGGPLLDRLAGTVADAWARRLAEGDADALGSRAALEAALSGRATLAARNWVADPALGVDVRMAATAERPDVQHEDGHLVFSLPFTWVAQVWARGLAVVLGRFVLAAEDEDGGGLLLDTVDVGLGERAPLVLRLPTR